MALSNYTELQAKIASRINRTDLTDHIPDFITLAEAKLNRRIRLRSMESTHSLTLASGASTIALPAGYTEPVALWLVKTQGRDPLRFRAPADFVTYTAAAEPEAWTIDGSDIRFDRPADAAYSVDFRMYSSVALSVSEPTNDLLTRYPDAYLYAAMQEAESFMLNNDEADRYAALLERVISEIDRKEARSRSKATLGVEAQMLPRTSRYA